MASTNEHLIETALNADDISANSEGQSSDDTDATIIETAPDKSDDTAEHLEDRSSDEPNQSGDLPSPRKRKRKKNAAEWKRQKKKSLRERDMAYDGLRKQPDSGMYKQDVKRSARKLGPRCSSKFCKQSSKHACGEIDNDKKRAFSWILAANGLGAKKNIHFHLSGC